MCMCKFMSVLRDVCVRVCVCVCVCACSASECTVIFSVALCCACVGAVLRPCCTICPDACMVLDEKVKTWFCTKAKNMMV